MISLFGCVVELGVAGVERSTFQECFGESFPTHQRTSNFVKWIKSYDCLKLLVCIRVFGSCLTIFGDDFPTTSISQINGNFLEKVAENW